MSAVRTWRQLRAEFAKLGLSATLDTVMSSGRWWERGRYVKPGTEGVWVMRDHPTEPKTQVRYRVYHEQQTEE